MMLKSVIAGCLAVTALGVGSVSAQVPTFEGGKWVLPQPSNHEVAAQGGGSYEDMIYEVCANEGCAVSPDTMIAVMYCESGGDHGAVAYNPQSGNYTYGIMQIDEMWGGDTMTPYQQIEYAAAHMGVDRYWACLGY